MQPQKHWLLDIISNILYTEQLIELEHYTTHSHKHTLVSTHRNLTRVLTLCWVKLGASVMISTFHSFLSHACFFINYFKKSHLCLS